LVVLVMMKVQGPLCVLQEVASAAVDEGCRQQWLARLAYQDGRRWQLKVRGSALNLLGCREPALGPLMVMKVQGVVLDLLLVKGAVSNAMCWQGLHTRAAAAGSWRCRDACCHLLVRKGAASSALCWQGLHTRTGVAGSAGG
jgi:hypothetical protein